MRTWLAEHLWDNLALRREWRPRAAAPKAAVWGAAALASVGYLAGAGWLSAPERSPWEARAALLVLSWLYLLGVNLGVPGAAAAGIAGERERGAWTELLLTELRPSQLVAAKYLAALWPAARVGGLLLPPWLLAAHAARLPAGRPLLLALVLVLPALAAAAAGLALSSRIPRTASATAWAYSGTTVLFWGTLPGVPALFTRGENLWWYLSPPWHAALLCLREPVGSPLARPLLPEWAWLALGCLIVTAAGLRSVLRRTAAWGERG